MSNIYKVTLVNWKSNNRKKEWEKSARNKILFENHNNDFKE